MILWQKKNDILPWCWWRNDNFWHITPRRLRDWKNAHVSPNYGTSVPVGTISEGIQNLEIFWGSALVFVDQQKPLKILVVDGIWGASEHFRKFLWTGFCIQGYKGAKMDPWKQKRFRLCKLIFHKGGP
jgi:hypothetical protein